MMFAFAVCLSVAPLFPIGAPLALQGNPDAYPPDSFEMQNRKLADMLVMVKVSQRRVE